MKDGPQHGNDADVWSRKKKLLRACGIDFLEIYVMLFREAERKGKQREWVEE